MPRPDRKELDGLLDVLVAALVREIEGESKLEQTRAPAEGVRACQRAAPSSSAEAACAHP